MKKANNKKCVAVLSSAALGVLIASALTTNAHAAVNGYVLKDAGDASKVVSFDKTALLNDYQNNVLGDPSPMFDSYMKDAAITGNFVAFNDSVKGLVSYDAVMNAYKDALLDGKDFSVDNFTETANDANLVKDVTPNYTENADGTQTAVTPANTKLAIDSVSAVTDTKLNVKFTEAVDNATAENFSIAGATVNSATLSADKTETTLDVSGLQVEQPYTVKVTGLKVNAVAQEDLTKDFTMPKADSLFSPELSFSKTSITANGEDSALVTFTLKDANGNVMKDADGVEVAFSSTFGNLAEKRVTVQNGVATVLLKSETLDKAENALVTAQVVEANNKNLYGLEKQASISMDPNPNSGTDQTVGATMTQVQASQADRVTVFFNKDVDVTKYATKGTYALDAAKATATVYSKVANNKLNDPASDDNANKNSTVIGIEPVQGNSKALQLVLDKPLTDNSNVVVSFTDKTGSLQVPSIASCKLTDSRRPAMLGVERNGLTQLKVTFSEPVDATTANAAANWVIDGEKLSDGVYGSSTAATAAVGDFNTTDGTDTRNVVTITLGKDNNGNQIYFKSGAHSIQGSSIGDWANITDAPNNVMNTETLDFDVPVDTEAPNATVEVQSPEQYIVSFDKDLASPLTLANVKLQKYNKDKATWEDYTAQGLKLTQIAGTSKYKVEVTKDWTDAAVYDTTNTHLNYYNDSYRLVIPKDSVANAANGIKNVEQDLTLGGSMTTPDVTSPVISDITEVKDANGNVTAYNATMSEPVKISTDAVNSSDGEPTLAEGQTKLPVATAQFIKKDGSKTIDGTVSAAADPYDKTISVVPKTALDNGDWTLVVRSISDDIGNTAASVTKDFTVNVATPTQQDSKFAVKWAFADQDTVLNPVDHGDADTNADYIYVKFNKAESITGDAANVLKTSNYSLDGAPLPTGTQITANIAGYDDKDGVNDSITIKLPQNTLNGKNDPHVLTVSSYLESTTAGDTLTNGGALKLAWNVSSADDLASDMVQTLVGNNATVQGDMVTVSNGSAKLVDLLTVSNISNIPTIKIGGTTIADSTMTADQVKTAVASALGKPADQVTLSDLIGEAITVNGTAYTVK